MPPRSGVDPALAATIKSLRLAAGKSQETVAHDAKLSVASYARIERAEVNPTWTTVKRIATALETTLTELARAAERGASGSHGDI